MKKFFTITKGEEGKVEVVGTDESVDRDGDIVRAEGLDVSNYKKSPVVMFGHKWSSLPIGKVGKIVKDKDKVIFRDIEFADIEEAQKVKHLVENGYLNSVSIGFIPKKSVWLDESGIKQLKEMDGEWYTKNKNKLNKARRVIWEAELLELSFVPIPANPNAQVVMANKGFDYMCAFKSPSITEEEEDILIEIPLEEVKNAVSANVHRTYEKADEGMAWDARKAVNQLRKWASSDGSGDKDKIDWRKYKKGFAWYDANAPEEFGSYKLPHHYIIDGKLAVVWRGVATAMATLLGARGGVDIPADDKRGVYTHLKKHYGDFDKEAPELRDYTLEEAIKEFDEDTLEAFVKEMDAKEIVEIVKKKDDEILSLKGALEETKKKEEEKKEKEEPENEYNNNTEDNDAPSKKDADDSVENVLEIEGVSLEELKALMSEMTIKKIKGE